MQKEGLRQKLNDWVKSENGKIIPIDLIETRVKAWGYKISNYERRLRPSESPNIAPVWNEKHTAIVGYYWRPQQVSITAQDFMRRFPSQTVEVKTEVKEGKLW